jgi:triphosphoribosyl-dephospho-CoA synthase
MPTDVMPDIENSHFPASDRPLREAVWSLTGGQTTAVALQSPGGLATAASLLEATARKPGNVHPEAAFPDLSYADLRAAAWAIGPPLNRAGREPLGQVIDTAVAASRAVSRSNANLGIVLAIAPLTATVASDSDLSPATVRQLLAKLDEADAAAIYAAIRTAAAGGLGRRPQHDVAGPAPRSILTAMQVAAEATPGDSIAALWALGYESLWRGPVADLAELEAAGCGWEETIVRAAVRQLARTPDSLIARRHGLSTAIEVSRQAAAIADLSGAAWLTAVAHFDRSLRRPRRLNPGTTADLIAAALYIHLWRSLTTEG